MTREVLGKLIRQEGGAKKLKESWKGTLFYPTSKTEILLTLTMRNCTAPQVNENFYQVLDILNPKEGDIKKIKNSLTSLEITKKLKEYIPIMLRESFQFEVNNETIEKLIYLRNVIPASLEVTDIRLLFENLWEILKKLRFSEEQIGCAWRISLDHALD